MKMPLLICWFRQSNVLKPVSIPCNVHSGLLGISADYQRLVKQLTLRNVQYPPDIPDQE
ncbi:MAG: hypothetical protein TR69_WS6001001156 [candidate division WS6 bacterium OLB20]|uniref:Uncharacterized protein n=1 Tax=candidate division WS6 bacterium OLB20 TaxID=1617426 RepID=A0A136LWX7_9BACT|nr:MAG: hypothetical protein TR69_WS6001001156 [candidate division WS6 bacterium OLB20]